MALTTGTDNLTGTTGDDIFLSPNNGLGAGDVINGLAGRDIIALTESGTLNASLATLTSIEELQGSAAADTIIIARSTQSGGVTRIDGGAGNDTLQLNDSAIDLSATTLVGIERITGAAGSSVTVRVADFATAQLLDGAGLNMTLDARLMVLSEAQRQQLFARGIDVILQPDGYLYDADGSVLRTSNAVQVNTGSGSAEWPAVAHLSDGGYIVTWDMNPSGERGIWAQRYAPGGAPVGMEFRVDSGTHAQNSYGDRFRPTVAGLADGGYVITWASLGQDGSYNGIYAQRYTSTGVAIGSETRVNTTTLQSQYLPEVDTLANGDYVITWRSTESIGLFSDVYFQRFDASGVPQGTEVGVKTTPFQFQDDPAITHLTSGGFVVIYTSPDAGGIGVYMQRYDASGVTVGSEARVNTVTDQDQHFPAVTGLVGGGYVVTWASFQQDGSGYGIYMQRYDNNGNALGSETLVNTTTASAQLYPAVTALSGGGYVVTWKSDGGSYNAINLQRYDANGARVGPEMRVNPDNDSGTNPAITALANDGFVVTWTSGFSLYQRVFADGLSFWATGSNDVLVGNANSETFHTKVSELAAGDTLNGGLGIDTLVMTDAGVLNLVTPTAFSGIERIVGSSGMDAFVLTAARIADVTVIDGAGGTNFIQLGAAGTIDFRAVTLTNIAAINGSGGNDTIIGSTSNDVIYGNDGNDTITGGAHSVGGWNTLNGGNGNDTVSYALEIGKVYADLTQGAGYIDNGSGFILNDALAQFENITGGAGNDAIIGNANANILNGGGGNDVIFGRDGNDTLIGGGHTVGGYDVMYGEGGIDTASFEGVTGRVYADLLTGNAFGVSYVDTGSGFVHDSLLFTFENLIGGSGNDILLGNENANTLAGSGGNDFILGQAGNDTIIGGDGNNSLYGDAGNDLIVMGAGFDIATGGADADTFAWSLANQGADIVSDFNHAQGDKIQLDHTAFGVAQGLILSLGTSFRIGAGATATSATATVIFDTTTNILWFDIDGTGGQARQAITFLSNGAIGLTASDFVFS